MDDSEPLNTPPAELVDFVSQLAKAAIHHRTEERAFPRYKLTSEVRAQAIGSNFEPLGEAFTVVSRDISSSGIGLMHTRAIRDKYLWLRLSTPGASRLNVIVEVIRCRPLGTFYDVGTKFVAKLDEAKGFELPT